MTDNGGPTKTQALGAGSAAIDAGAGCAATDQRGLARPSGPACDIGAYEVTPPAVTAAAAGAIGATVATLTGSVTANAGAATAEFQFGTTSSYGQSAAVTSASGLTAQAETAALTGLTPGMTYHFRLVASSSDGTSASPDQTFTIPSDSIPTVATVVASRLSQLKLKPVKFKTSPRRGRAKGRTGTTISYTDSQTAQTTFVVFAERSGVKHGSRCLRPVKHARGTRCTLLAKVLTFTHTDDAGANSLRFSRHLAAGRYLLQATATDDGQAAQPLTVSFTVVRSG